MLNSRDVFEYEGYGHAGVLNRLTQRNVRVLRAETLGNRLILHTRVRDRQKIIDLFNELCYNYILLKTEGILPSIVGIFKRTGLAVGLLAITVAAVLMPYYVYEVRVKSETVDVVTVEEVLRAEGVESGKFKFRINATAIEGALQRIDGVAFATVSRRGAVISVELFEELPPVTVHDVTGAGQIVSTSDAVISRQLIYSGTATKAKGDVVKRGEVLIDGALTIGEARVETTARGEVYGIVGYSASVLYGESRTERVRSGKATTVRLIELGGIKGVVPKAPYAMYESKTTRIRSGIIFPLDVTEVTFYELIDEECTAPFSVVEAEVVAEAMSIAEAKAPEGAHVVQRHARVTETGGQYLIEATVQVEQRIDDQNG